MLGGFTPAFNRQSLITVSNQGIIYVAWTDDFQIEKYNIDGVYKGVIGFSIEKVSWILSHWIFQKVE